MNEDEVKDTSKNEQSTTPEQTQNTENTKDQTQNTETTKDQTQNTETTTVETNVDANSTASESATNKVVDFIKKNRTLVGVIAGILLLVIVFNLGKMSNDEDYDDLDIGLETQVYNGVTSGTGTVIDETPTKGDAKTKQTSNGKLYNMQHLVDQSAGVNVFNAFIPQGWTASVQGNWQVVSPDFPGLESVTITSPDGKASIYIDSIQQFGDSQTMNEGVNLEYYTTYLHYMDADTFVQYYMDNAHPGSTLIKDLDDDPDTLSQANELNQQFVQKSRDFASQMSGLGYNFNTVAINPTMSKRQYQVGNGYLEGTAVVMGQTTTITTSFYSQTTTYWEVPYSIVFYAQDKESFDKYYDEYNFIIANSTFTTDLYAMLEYVSSYIANIKTSQAAAKSQAALDATNSYIDSNYSSTSSASTNDKVMEMWDDVIKEVDNYHTLDGDSIKTSIMNDVVAQDGDSFYVGTKAGIPEGYTELSKGY